MKHFTCTILLLFFTGFVIAQTADTARVYTLADTVVARRLLEEGTKLNNDRKLEEAFEKLTRAEEIYRTVIGVEPSKHADILHQLGRNKTFLYQHEKSIKFYEESLFVRMKGLKVENLEVARTYYNLGIVYYDIGNYEKAQIYYEKALELRINILGEEHVDVASALNLLGNTYGNLSKFKESLSCHKRALSIRSKKIGYYSQPVALSYNNLGNSYLRLEDYESCKESYKNALHIRLSILPENHEDIAASYSNLGVMYDHIEDYKKSMYYNTKALNIYIYNFGSNSPELIESYNNIGVTYTHMGNYEKALEFYEKTLSIASKESFEDKNMALIRAYNNVGLAYADKKNHDKAIVYYDKAIKLWKEIYKDDGLLLATLYLNKAESLWEKKGYKESLINNNNALNIYNFLSFQDNFDIIRHHINVGSVYLSMNKLDTAIFLFKNTLKLIAKQSEPYTLGLTICYRNLGDAFTQKGDKKQANYYYNLGLIPIGYQSDSLNNTEYLNECIGLLQNLAKLYLRHQDISYLRPQLDTAHSYAQQALAALEYQQKSISTEGSKAQLAENHYAVYEDAIETSLLISDLDKNDSLRRATFDYAEHSKSALLRAKMKESEALGFAGIPDSLLQQEYDLRVDISWREKQRQEKISAGQSETDSTILALSGKIFDLRQRYDTLKTLFESKYPEYYRAKYDLRTISLSEVQKKLLEPDQTLLEYFVGDSAVYVFVVNKDDYHVLTVKKDFNVDSLVRTMREGIVSRYDRPLTDSLRIAAPVAYTQSAALLYEKLVAPAKPYLKSRVVIVPDGPLGYLPFEALLTKRPEKAYRFKDHNYLLHEHQISYCYSATLLRDMRDLRQRKDKKQVPDGAWLGMAPYFTGDTTLLADLFSYVDNVRKDLKPLPFAGKEVANIATLMKGKPLYGPAANKKAFEQLAPQYRVLHLSTHGQANDRTGDYSFLAFGESKDSTDTDLLYVHDLYNYSLNADLVTLSACETGIGQLLRGEGIVSLARAFSYAGAKSIATSLWQVSDAKTQELMIDFYKGLKSKAYKDAALTQAKRKMAKSNDKSDPYYWASFILIGDTQPLIFK